jgi:Tfp pilus assembly pilus retraction ATPase PilT
LVYSWNLRGNFGLEILVVTPAISNLIREAKTFQIPGMLQVGKKYGMQTLGRRDHGFPQ